MKNLLINTLYGGLFLLLLLVFIARIAPATWLVYGFKQVYPGLEVQGVSGTVWQGGVSYSVISWRGGVLPLGQIRWRIDPFSLLRLQACTELVSNLDVQNIQATVCLGFDQSLSLSEARIRIPIDRLSPLLELDIGGTLEGKITRLLWQGENLKQAQSQLQWRNAALNNGSRWIALGDFQAQTKATTTGIDAEFNHIQSQQPVPLRLALSASLNNWPHQPVFQVQGTIGLEQSTQALRSLLQFVGKETRRNEFTLNINERG